MAMSMPLTDPKVVQLYAGGRGLSHLREIREGFHAQIKQDPTLMRGGADFGPHMFHDWKVALQYAIAFHKLAPGVRKR
jgi:hypothetical protein